MVCLSCFTFVTNQRKNIPPEMTIQECAYCIIFSVRSLLQFIVSVTYTEFLYIEITIVFKSSDEMHQSASIRLLLYNMILQLYTFLTFKGITI